MLQNISKELGYEETEKENSKRYNDTIKKMFSRQNIIVYILSFFISMVGFGDGIGISPFGLAMLAAAISQGVPVAMVFITGLVGTGIKFGINGILVYIVTCLFVLLAVILSKPQKEEGNNEKIKIGGRLTISVFLVQFIYILCTGFYFYDVLNALMISVMCYIFYKIFVNSISVVSEYGIKKVFSVEEVIGAGLIIAIAAASLGDLSIMSFSIKNIICIFIVLYLGWRNGILVGATSGITVGVVLSIIGGQGEILVAAYAISGMVAGLLNKFGKIGVVLGFVIGNIAVTYASNGGVANIIMFQEILIAAVGLLFVPQKSKISIEDVIPNTKLLPPAGRNLEESQETLEKLTSISQAVSEMANTYKGKESYSKNLEIFEDELISSLEGLEENSLYEDIYNNENIQEDIFDNLLENDVMTENGIISIFTKHNIYISANENLKKQELNEIREMIKAINSAYRISKNNFIWQKKIDENNKNVSEQLKTVSKAIDDIATEIKDTANDYAEEKNLIKTLLDEKNIELKDISIKKENTGRYIVNAYTNLCEDENGKNCPIKPIEKVISKVFDDKFLIQNQKCGIRLNKDICSYTYISDDKYILQTGIAKAKKENSIVSGDNISQTRLGDGKYLLAISDGMGSGADARRNSKIAISMLERLLNTGFDKETSINLINAAIMNANKEEMYATLDIEILDLYAGKMEILKNGACPTYIKRGKNVSVIKSESLPAGIINNVNIDIYDKDLQNGDIVVICSDGIIESSTQYANNELWLKYLLEDVQTDSPERIANIILKEAIDNNFGKAKDDMSVIAFRVNKK